jgi:hypothetical protein
MNKRPLQGTSNILELQENGYKSTVSAISEIIDNSIQAGSKNVTIVVICNTTVSSDEIEEILIIDDGEGMNKDVFNKALQMSSGTRSGAKSGLGKYGQGLPNASISQTKRVEVYTSQKGNILYNYIDLDEIHKSQEAFLPDIESVKAVNIPLVKAGKIDMPETGTIVRWVTPNRVKPKTAKTLKDHIIQEAGRIFRYYISGFNDGTVKYKTNISIKTFDFNGSNYALDEFRSVNSILPFDPMFLMKNSQMNELCKINSHPTSQIFDEPIKKIFNIDYNGKQVDTEVSIKISYVKKEERDKHGRNAGDASNPFGKAYLRRNLKHTSGYDNISIIRAGREIDAGSFGFVNDVSDNRNRWWSAEILVEPVLDHIIGIDNKKQQASNIKFLDTDELSDDDTHEVVRWISTFLHENIQTVKKIINSQNASSTKNKEKDGPSLPPGGTSEPGNNPAGSDTCNDNKVKKDLYKWIKDRYKDLSDNEILRSVEHAIAIRDHHIFINQDLGDTKLYNYSVFGTKVLIEINHEHAFYKYFLHEIEESSTLDDPNEDKLLRSFRLLIGSMVNADIVNKTNDQSLLNDRKKIRNRMAESLDEYITNLFSS